MFLKSIDILTPKITLLQSGSFRHSSIISGVLSICFYLAITITIFSNVLDIIKRETMSLLYYQSYQKEIESVQINNVNLFHYLVLQNAEGKTLDFDERYINIIGLKARTDALDATFDSSTYDHWIYSNCNISLNSSAQNIEIRIPSGSICIKGYYNHNTKQIIDINNVNFSYPKIENGIDNTGNYIPYNIMIQPCDVNMPECREKIYNNEYMLDLSSVYVNVIDSYVQVRNFETPIKNYIHTHKVQTSLFYSSSTNFKFNPVFVDTDYGLISTSISKAKNFILEEISETSELIFGGFGRSIFTFTISNHGHVYERSYLKISDIACRVSSLSFFFFIFFYILNYTSYQFTMYNNFIKIFKAIMPLSPYTNSAPQMIKVPFKKASFQNNMTNKSSLCMMKTKNVKKYYVESMYRFDKIFCIDFVYSYFCPKKANSLRVVSQIRSSVISEERMVKSYLFYERLKYKSGNYDSSVGSSDQGMNSSLVASFQKTLLNQKEKYTVPNVYNNIYDNVNTKK